uniref:Poly [ADP-ribose] polymerase n=1 Tax=Leptobrachium leishanense TaxID=445787 RepID=A0A8C5MY84_9ANUR
MQAQCELVIENVAVTVKNGDITKEDVNALVNLTNLSLNYKQGVSKAILEGGGAPLQEECKGRGKQVYGDVVVTGAGHLKCKHVLHIVGACQLFQIGNAVKKVLEECDNNNLASVAFPAIGTGTSGVDPQESLKSMLKAIREYLSGTRSFLQRISIVAFTPHTYQEYMKVAYDEMLKNQNLRVIINGNIVELVKGDITAQAVDCILNITNATMNFAKGVSGAILSAAGPAVANECAQFGPLMTGSVAVTTGGNLQSKHIMHIIGPKSLSAFAPAVEMFLTESKAKSFKTVALPTIGTGTVGISPARSINAILDGLERCLANMNAAEFTKILIVAYDDNVYSAFMTAFQTRQQYLHLKLTINETIVELVRGDITEQPVDCILNLSNATLNRTIGVSGAILHAAGQTVAGECAQIGRITPGGVAVTSGGNLKSKHIMHTIAWNSISEFAPSLETVLTECAAKSFKTVALPAIGTGVASISPALSINAILDGIEKCLAKMNPGAFTKIVIAAYDEDVYKDYLKVIQAKQKENQSVVNNPHQVQGTLNPTNTESSLNVNQNSDSTEDKTFSNTLTTQTNVQQVPNPPANATGTINQKLLFAYLTEPAKWTPMEGQVYKEVELHKDSPEYKSVADKFTKSAANSKYQISKIRRIQNVGLWQKYAFIKFTIDQLYPNHENEKHLYHGTDYKTTEKINMHGYNRAFCGKNATSFGKGTYFAKNALYSCNDTYSVKDETGEKHVYQAAVITGKWCLGDKNYLEPPPTIEDPRILYNSTVNNVTNPTLFVVYNDYCAYPEYLISFTSSN